MGPKKKSNGGGGKKKPSKAEKLRMQREEEERRLLEEQEARLRAELEEATRRETERKEREKMELLEAKDNERRGIELAELSVLEASFMKASQWKADLRVSAKWKHYTGCDGTPDPMVPQEINTFMSLWREDKNSDIQVVIEKGNGVLELIQKLRFSILETPYEELRVDDVLRHQITIQKLQALLHQKYNNATEQLLKQAHSYAESESGNMEVVIKASNITLCLWANLKKNPRFRNQIFRDEARNPTNGFELPKPLTICDIAVRIMHTHYDHLSPVVLFPSKPANLGFQAVLPPPAGTVETKEGGGAPKMAKEMSLVIQPEPSTHLAKMPSNILSSHEVKNIEAGEIPVTVSNGKAAPSCSLFRAQISTVEVAETGEELAPEDCIVDLEQFMPVGGVYYFDCLKLPPQAKQMRGWTMVQVLDTGLENYPYSAVCEETEDPSHYIIGLTLQLLDSIILFEEPLIGRWDPAGRMWPTSHRKQVAFLACA